MAKHSTLSSNAYVISLCEKNLKQDQTEEQFAPGDAVISNILAFSKALRVEKSEKTGLIEIVLN